MKKIDLNQAISALGNIGVIVGIVFLILELEQLQEQMEAQANYNFFSAVNSGLIQTANSPYFAGVGAKILSNAELTDEESFSAEQWLSSILVLWEYGWREMEAGRYDVEQYSIAEKIRTWNNLVPLREQWEAQSASMNPGFVRFMQENVIDQ